MILIYWAVYGQRLCKEQIHEVTLFKSQPFLSLERCRKNYEKYQNQGIIEAITVEFLSYTTKYIIDNSEAESPSESETSADDSDHEDALDARDGINSPKRTSCLMKMKKIKSHKDLTSDIRLKWTIYLLDKCEFEDHRTEHETSKETFSSLRDCFLNFCESKFDRFNPRMMFEVVINLVN